MSQESIMFMEDEDLELNEPDNAAVGAGNPITLSADEALHGGADESSPTPESTPTPASNESTPVVPPKKKFGTFFGTIVSALGRHETQVTVINAFGKEVTKTLKSKDVFEIELDAFAKLRATESKDKWDPEELNKLPGIQRFGKRAERFFSNMWRGMASEKAHLAKERRHGMKLSAAVGIEGAVSEEFHALIDTKAREKIKDERKGFGKKVWGGAKDFFGEFLGLERDLHKYKVEEAAKLRAEYFANPADSNHPIAKLLNRDIAAREELAARVGESSLEILQQTNEKDKKVIGIKLEKGSDVDNFFKNEIIAAAMDDTLSQMEENPGRPVTKIREKRRIELDQKLQNFFFTPQFQEWKSKLKPEEQAQFESSFTVASNFLLQYEEVMLPAIETNAEILKTNDRLDFDIELTLGTAQLSARTESMGESIFSKERASLNTKLMDKVHRQFTAKEVDRSSMYGSDPFTAGLKWQQMLYAGNTIFLNDFTAAWAGAAVGRSLVTSARTVAQALPVIGSIGVAGGFSFLKEWARTNEMRSTYGFARGNGLEFPEGVNAVKSAEMRASDKHRVEFGARTQQFLEAHDKLNSGSYDNNTILLAATEIADSMARLRLNNQRDLNLLVPSVDGPVGQGIHNRELRVHDQAFALLSAKLTEILSDEGKRSEIATAIGLNPADIKSAEHLITHLAVSQYDMLLSGVTVNPALAGAIQGLEPKLIVEKTASIRARDKIFNKKRWGSSLKHGAISGGAAGLFTWGLGEYAEMHSTVQASGVETINIPALQHELPAHVDPLPVAHIYGDGEMLSTSNVYVPEGTHLELIEHATNRPGEMVNTYNLVTDYTTPSGAHEVLADNLTFRPDGTLVMDDNVTGDFAANHLAVHQTAQAPVTWGGHEVITGVEKYDTSGWTNSIVWGEQPGMSQGGLYGWVNVNLRHWDTPAGVERVTELDSVNKLFQATEEHFLGWDNAGIPDEDQIPGYPRTLKQLADGNFLSVRNQPDNVKIFGLPPLLSTEDGHKQIVQMMDEAVLDFKNGEPFDSDAHKYLFESVWYGDEAHELTKEKTFTILEALGSAPTQTPTHEFVDTITDTPYNTWITLTEDLSKTVTIPHEEVYTQTFPSWVSKLPITFNWLHPLESPELRRLRVGIETPKVPPFYFGYPSGGLESWKQYGQWLEKIGLFPPQVEVENTRDVRREQERINEYLKNLKDEEKLRLDEFASQLPAMDPNCRVVINIPAYHEERGIYHTLEEWANQNEHGQPIDKSKYEINVIVNREESANDDNTYNEVVKFQKTHPDVHLNLIKVVFPNGKGGVGAARKVITDLTLLRSASRKENQKGSLYIETEDADLLEIDRSAVSNLISKFDSNPALDALRGKQDLAPQILKEHDYLFFETRVERLTEYLLRDSKLRPEINPSADSRWNAIVLGGWNSAYTAEAYALIGGYQNVKIGEDVDIGTRIALMRGKRLPNGSYLPNTKVISTVRNIGQSNPRRFVHALVTKKHAYHTFGDAAVDQAVRDSDPTEVLKNLEEGKRVSPENAQLFESVVNTNYQWLKNVIKDKQLLDSTFSRLMMALGFSKYKESTNSLGQRVLVNGALSEKAEEGWKLDYHFENDGRVKIDNVGNIAAALERYRQNDKSNPWGIQP